jgi:hypothetical protein
MRKRWYACTVIISTILTSQTLTDEASVVAALEKLGATIERDEKQPGKPVVQVEIVGTKATDADVKNLTALKRIRSLSLGNTKVTDSGVKELAALKGLQSLDLRRTKVTDAGVKELTGLRGIQMLLLGGTEVTDASVAHWHEGDGRRR